MHSIRIVTSGEFGCPLCGSHTCSLRLKEGKKFCYMGHRRFLDPNHEYRFDEESFDGVELGTAPVPLSREEVLALTENMKTVFGKDPSGKITTKKRKVGEPPMVRKRKSIWFRLRYWKDLLQPHNLDAMHIEKNVCENIINTLLCMDRKSKDNYSSGRDLEHLGIRKALQPVPVGEQFDLPAAPYAMDNEKKKLFCEILKEARFPDGCASDIRRNVLVKQKKIVGLKSHDNHILLQQLLPLAVRNTLPKEVGVALVRVSRFFKQIYSPVISISDMEKLEGEIAETLSILEAIFLPSFFDLMVHLMVHLPTQVRLGGPIKYSSMYPVERYNMKLKGFKSMILVSHV
ncbi:uncharacterized protein LOC125551759 isoform X2 [Triticum urartu]|uniref:uncharacterized protein LOC125551759 isoform X2 n=1 Tax=Triticum urartu TaxID=4572 RepID=UPI00204445DE|nr:uncharacterized protein LOC125551759 isoform X2 [Triticum urartu]